MHMAAASGNKISQTPDLTLVFDDGELQVHSRVLCLASPVLDAMLSSGLAESRSERVEISITTKEAFESFYKLLMPFGWNPSEITEQNFEELLKISDYYQVLTVKEQCAAVLRTLPATVSRLLLAHQYSVPSVYRQFLQDIASSCSVDVANDLMLDAVVMDDLLSVIVEQGVTVTMHNVDGLLELVVRRNVAKSGADVTRGKSPAPVDMSVVIQRCTPVYKNIKATVPRLIRAKKLGLQEPVYAFIEEITLYIDKHDLNPLAEHPDLMLLLLQGTQMCVGNIPAALAAFKRSADWMTWGFREIWQFPVLL